MLREFLSYYGISPHHFPKITDQYVGGLVVCGDARCVWDDLERFGCRKDNGVEKWGWDFCTVNRLVETFPGRVEHCYSNVGQVLQRFIRARRDEYINEFPIVASHSCTDSTDFIWPWTKHGTSGFGAILTGLALGYSSIVLCGMPLSNEPHNGEPHWRVTGFTTEVPETDIHWKRLAEMFKGKVTSMSGRTKDWLGEPY